MRHWIITTKERKHPHPFRTEHHGNLDKDGIIEFFGLHFSDVEWYRIEEVVLVEEKENTNLKTNSYAKLV